MERSYYVVNVITVYCTIPDASLKRSSLTSLCNYSGALGAGKYSLSRSHTYLAQGVLRSVALDDKITDNEVDSLHEEQELFLTRSVSILRP